MGTNNERPFFRMARAYPVRTFLFTFGPVAFALVQLANSYLNDASLVVTLGFAVVVVAFAVLATQYHLAQFRLSRVAQAEGRDRS